MQRHYGMDWLRVGAFMLLILYHAGMVFTPWPFHVKSAQPVDWLALVMMITNPWRLTLLFVVSGYASRALLAKSGGVQRFLANRTSRLLIPLAFGVAVMVPPQAWVELVTQHGYAGSYGHFLLTDYFRFTRVGGIFLPGWNHLWFVAYLWVYTLALGLVLLVPRPARAQRWFDVAFGGWRVVVLPCAYLLLSQVFVFHRWTDSQVLIADGIAHLAYVPAFLFGFALAGSPAVLSALRHKWAPTLALAVASYGFGAWVKLVWPGSAVPPQWVGDWFLATQQLQCWATVAALIGMADRFAHRDHKWRRTLTEAVFPFYLIHQTAIVLIEYWIRPLALGNAAEFAILVVMTLAVCWAFYLAGREVNWLRPLIGLKRRSAPPLAVATTLTPIRV